MSGLLTVDGADYLLRLFSGDPAVSDYHVALVGPAKPGITTAGAELDEPIETSYARGVITAQSGAWYVYNGSMTSDLVVTFPLASSNWGQIHHWAICDAEEGGRVFWIGDFIQPFFVSESDQLTLPPGAISLGLDLFGWSA